METTTQLFNFSQGNYTSNPTEMPEPPLYIFVFAAVCYLLIFLTGITGNILVIVVICRIKKMRTRMNFFLTNLSITDLFVLLLCLPSAAVDLFSKEVWYFGETMCKLVPFLENAVTCASVLTILTITFDRYRGICHPMSSYPALTGSKVIGIIIVIWFLASMSSVPITFIAVHKDSHFHDGTPIKVCRIPIKSNWHKAYIVIQFIVYFCISFLLLVYFFICMSRKLLKHMYFLETVNDNDSESTVRGRRQVVVMLFMVVILFFLCVLPQRILGLWLIYARKEQLKSLKFEGYLNLVTFSRLLLYLNSAINPIIYSCVSTKFRGAFKEILTTKKSRPMNQICTLTTRSRSSQRSKRRHTEETETMGVLKRSDYEDKDIVLAEPFLSPLEAEK